MIEQQFDIEKAAAVILRDRKLTLTRSKGKDFFASPEGKLESGETHKQACVRELGEELGIIVAEEDLRYLDTYYAEAAGVPGSSLKMSVWLVNKYSGEMSPQSEIDEITEVSSRLPEGIGVGSIFEHYVIPWLEQQDLVD